MENKNELEKAALFDGQKIRRILVDGQWWFSVVDVVAILSQSSEAKRYWSDLKIKLKDEGSQLYEKIVQLKLEASDGKKYATDCANTEGILRIIQSIPSPKAEPFKRWLAKVGYERLQVEDMELILTMLDEAATTKLTQVRDSQGFVPLKKDAKDGGDVAGRTREDLEKTTGAKIISPKNFLNRKNIE